MIHCTGFYFCGRSIWNKKLYDCSNLVGIEAHDKKYGAKDFRALLTNKDFFDADSWKNAEKRYTEGLKKFKPEKEDYNKTCKVLKPEVRTWLDENVRDTSKEEKGWCVGDDFYNSHDATSFSIFFYRRKDALAFIGTWSVHKQPTETFNQNTGVKKQLNLETNKLEVTKR